MGKKDSTKTRVEPLMDYLGKNVDRINQFLSLFGRNVQINDNIKDICYGKKTDGHKGEQSIPAPISLLEWYVNNSDKLAQEENKQNKYGNPSKETIECRKRFFNGDNEKIEEAKKEIKALRGKKIYTYSKKNWYIFEGYTNPDIYIETELAIFVGETKRTEPKLTGSVKWYKQRDQLIRHVDSVFDSGKKVYSFFILENKDYANLEKHGKDFEYYKKSLPHRTDAEIKEIMKTYIGCITWSELVLKFPELKLGFGLN